jgi:5-methylcytosine-specific restriction enzyme subunit McrC
MKNDSASELGKLRTYKDSPAIDLDPLDLEFIITRLQGKVDVRRLAVGGGFVLNPRQFACVVPLPSGIVLRSRPRIPVHNLFLMLAYTYGLPPITFPETAEFDELDDILEMVVSYFADLVEDRLEQGLYRAYVEQEDNLGVIRGRIAFTEDVRRNLILRQRTYCRFTEFVWDIPENQALRFVAHALSGWGFGTETRMRLEGIDRRLDEVSLVRISSRDLEGFTYHRLNVDYQPMHDLCRLFLDEMSLSEEEGEHRLNGFILNMNDLFELFTAEVLRREVPERWDVRPQESSYLGKRQNPDGGYRKAIRIVPDIVIRKGTKVGAVLDSKFKRTSSATFQHHDFYQVLSYCTSLGSSLGALIYPKSELDLAQIDETLIQRSPVSIRRFAIDLAVAPEAFPQEISRLSSEVYSWVGSPEPALRLLA